MAVKTLRKSDLKAIPKKGRKKKRLGLTPETRRDIRTHMPARYKLMAEIIDEARNRRTESLQLLGVIDNDAREIHASCPRCGHRFGMKSPARADL